MMKSDHLEELFRTLENEFDLETPSLGHEQRFLDRLNASHIKDSRKSLKRPAYKAILAIAASFLICFGMFIFLQQKNEVSGLASVSEELSQTQDFFTAAISSELTKIKAERTLENEILISDALKHLDLLEKNYGRLKIDLQESGQDQRVVYAMISNFQNRIEILENVLKTIESLKEFKQIEQNQTIL